MLRLLLRVRQGILAEATVRQETPARPQMGQGAFGRPACTKRHLVPVCSERYPSQRPQGLIRTAWDAIVQDCSRPPARSERRLETDGTSASAPARALGYNTSTFERPLIHRGRELSLGSLIRRNHFFLKHIFFPFLEQRLNTSSIRQAFPYFIHQAIASSARYVSHFGRAPSNFPFVPACPPS